MKLISGTSVGKLVTALALASGLALVAGSVAHAHTNGYEPRAEGFPNEIPKQFENVGIDEHLGDTVDLSLTFKDEDGNVVPLSKYFGTHKPVLLSLAYFNCPSLCNFHMNGLTDAFKQIKAPLGQEFDYVVVSIEPKETPELAKAKKAAYLEAYGRPEGAAGWHFLTTDKPENVQKLAKQVGFKYRWDEDQKQWAHASAAYALTPDGRISRYLYGIVFDPKVVRLSMVEASNGMIGTIVDKLTLFCFHFDPKASKYTLAAFNVMRAGGILTVLILAGFLLPFWFRSRHQGEA